MSGLVTLVTDASYEPRLRVAGWAAWGKGPSGLSEKWSGPVPQPVTSACEAELYATLAGFRHAIRNNSGCDVLLQSDSQRALMLLRWRFRFRNSKQPDGMEIALKPNMTPTLCEHAILSDWASEWAYSCAVIVRHVKGHVRRGNGRYWVNNECDRMAKATMRVQLR